MQSVAQFFFAILASWPPWATGVGHAPTPVFFYPQRVTSPFSFSDISAVSNRLCLRPQNALSSAFCAQRSHLPKLRTRKKHDTYLFVRTNNFTGVL
jgi:hypothetical protein